MANEDVYSTKDSNKNIKIDERQSNIFNGILFICGTIIVVMLGIYFDHHNPFSPTATPVPEAPAIKSDKAHPYDMNTPPYKQ